MLHFVPSNLDRFSKTTKMTDRPSMVYSNVVGLLNSARTCLETIVMGSTANYTDEQAQCFRQLVEAGADPFWDDHATPWARMKLPSLLRRDSASSFFPFRFSLLLLLPLLLSIFQSPSCNINGLFTGGSINYQSNR